MEVLDVFLGCSQFRGRFGTSELTHRPTRNTCTTECFNSLELTSGEKPMLSWRLKIDCPCYFLLVLSADLGNPLFIFEIINCLTSVWFYLWMFWMNPLNVLSSEVALRLVNRHIGPQGVQLTALLVCSGGSFHERTEVVLRKVTLLSKKLMFVIIYLYSLEVDLTKLSVCLKRIL